MFLVKIIIPVDEESELTDEQVINYISEGMSYVHLEPSIIEVKRGSTMLDEVDFLVPDTNKKDEN